LVVRTDARWTEFLERVLGHLDRPRDEIQLGYRIRGDARGPSYLICEYDWVLALRRVREKILSARKRAVTVELKDMVSMAHAIEIIIFTYMCRHSRFKGGAAAAAEEGEDGEGGDEEENEGPPATVTSPQTPHKR
jgi:hypothetical protein